MPHAHQLAAFTASAPLPTQRIQRAKTCAAPPVTTRAARHRRCQATRGAASDDAPRARSLRLQRRQIESGVRTGRTLRLKRRATLADIGVEEGDATQPVQVELRIARVRGDYRVAGRVQTVIRRECDRCACAFAADVDGTFEVWLVDDDGDEERAREKGQFVYEAVESFDDGVPFVDLHCHVRDGVLLGVPTKALCRADCAGVATHIDDSLGSVRYAGQTRADDVEQAVRADRGRERASAELLEEFKRRLERRGG